MQDRFKNGVADNVEVINLIGVVIAVWHYLRSRSYESTDDALVEADIIQVSPRVHGQVERVCVRDNQHVKQGDPLLDIDPADYQARLGEAQAKLSDTLARASGAQSNLGLASDVAGAVLIQANAALARGWWRTSRKRNSPTCGRASPWS